MTNDDQATTELRRLIEAAKESYEGHSSPEALSSFVHGLVLPPLIKLLNDTIHSMHRIQPYPKSVVHYTSLSHIVSMLERDDGRIRLYDANQSNDPEEGMYLPTNLRFPTEYSWVHDLSPASLPGDSHAYVASFVVADGGNPHDDLIYWRTYGKEGAGCSLELVNLPGGLRRVLYGEDAIRDILQQLTPVVAMLDSLARVDEAIGRIVSATLWEALNAIRYLYKAEDYRFEEEARYVIRSEEIDTGAISFDPQGSSVFPSRIRHYTTWDALDLKELLHSSDASITLGPSMRHVAPDIDEMKRSLRLMLRKHGLEGVNVRESSISYRQM